MSTDEPLTFHDITDSSAFAPEPVLPILWILIGAAIFLIFVLAILLYLKNRPAAPLPTVSRIDQALEQLERITAESADHSVQHTASALSSLLRQTLTTLNRSPSAYQTQQEYHETDLLAVNSQSLKADLTQHLDTLWELEYSAPDHNREQLPSLLVTTETLLTKLKHLSNQF